MSAKVRDHSERLSSLLESGVDWKTRTVWIVGELSEGKGYKLVPALRLLDETKGPIKVVLMSVGGSESEGFAIFDTIQTMKNEVTTIGFGAVYSIAAMIFQAATGRRLLAKNAELMMHNGSVELPGGDTNSDSIKELAEEARRNDARYHRIISDQAGVPLDLVEKWCKDETFFDAEYAVGAGLADGIVERKDL